MPSECAAGRGIFKDTIAAFASRQQERERHFGNARNADEIQTV